MTLKFLQFLLSKYSASSITQETDRAIAIHSLVMRMEKALNTTIHYGIPRLFLAFLLLWKRTEQNGGRIQYKDQHQVPSWSWMAYSGGIDFLIQPSDFWITFEFLDIIVPRPEDLDFAEHGRALDVKFRSFSAGCRVESKEGKYLILKEMEEIGYLWVDMADQIEFEDCNCVVVGAEVNRKGIPTYCIIVTQKNGPLGRYERVGVGKVLGQYVSKDCISEKLW